jgi:hypothetical protein
VSRAVRVPSRLERDSVLVLGIVNAALIGGTPGVFVPVGVNGSRDLKAEELMAYELGHRVQLTPELTLDTTVFLHDYTRLIMPDAAGKTWNDATGGDMKVCRRVQGSGTHARTAITFLQTGCGRGGSAMAQPLCTTKEFGAACLNAGVEGGSGSGELTDCMNGAAGASKWALGYHSVEKNADLIHPFRFVKVDGFAPTLDNMLSGNYANFGEVTMQKRCTPTGTAVGLTYVGAPSNIADVDDAFDIMVAAMQGPAAAQALNASSAFRHPFGNSGWAARPVNGNSPYPIVKVGGVVQNPVNPLTHTDFSGGSVQNTCFGPVAPLGSLVD